MKLSSVGLCTSLFTRSEYILSIKVENQWKLDLRQIKSDIIPIKTGTFVWSIEDIFEMFDNNLHSLICSLDIPG